MASAGAGVRQSHRVVPTAVISDVPPPALGPNARAGILESLAQVFLPVGFPATTAPGYLRFQILDSIQGLSSYLRGILATQALFSGMGVGDVESTALAATLQWVTRDGASMLGSLIFAWLGATSFDRNVRQWRLFADLINDFGLTIEMLAPAFKAFSPTLFVPAMCLASVSKSLCGVAAGATRATISLHFARADNLADLCAKEGTQETAVTLIGLLCGMAFARAVNSNATAIWIAFAVLTVVHVVANIGAVRCLHLASINALRWELILPALLDSKPPRTPAEVAELEPLLLPLSEFGCLTSTSTAALLSPFPLGCTRATLNNLPSDAVASAIEHAEMSGSRHAVVMCSAGCKVLLHHDASAADLFIAAFDAALWLRSPAAAAAAAAAAEPADPADPAAASLRHAVIFTLLRDAGWDTSRCVLPTVPWRQTWGVKRKRI